MKTGVSSQSQRRSARAKVDRLLDREFRIERIDERIAQRQFLPAGQLTSRCEKLRQILGILRQGRKLENRGVDRDIDAIGNRYGRQAALRLLDDDMWAGLSAARGIPRRSPDCS